MEIATHRKRPLSEQPTQGKTQRLVLALMFRFREVFRNVFDAFS